MAARDDRRVVGRVRSVLGDPGELAERLSASDSESLPSGDGEPVDAVTEAARLERGRVVDDGVSRLVESLSTADVGDLPLPARLAIDT